MSREPKDREPKELMRAVIKEELVALTGDTTNAVILNQMLYWQKRTKDTDKYIAEEKARAEQEGKQVTIEPTCGWFYKSAIQLANEIMMGIEEDAVGNRLKKMVKKGWLLSRHNPIYKWDRKLQYRVNIRKVDDDLRALYDEQGVNLGYFLEGWAISRSASIPMGSGMDSEDDKDVHSAPDRNDAETTEIKIKNKKENSKKQLLNSDSGATSNDVTSLGNPESSKVTKVKFLDSYYMCPCDIIETDDEGRLRVSFTAEESDQITKMVEDKLKDENSKGFNENKLRRYAQRKVLLDAGKLQPIENQK